MEHKRLTALSLAAFAAFLLTANAYGPEAPAHDTGVNLTSLTDQGVDQ